MAIIRYTGGGMAIVSSYHREEMQSEQLDNTFKLPNLKFVPPVRRYHWFHKVYKHCQRINSKTN
jgi:hypothetical protein